MATTYDKASLVMIPSGVKESKVYSIKPTDGSGDFTFSRGTDTATRVNSSGLIEKETSNQLLQSNSFDTTWVNSSSTETSGQSGYDGSSDAWLFTKTAASGRIHQNLTASGVLTFSLYLKANASTWALIQINGTANDSYVYADLINGTTGSIGNGNIAKSIEDIGNGWYRLSVSTNDSVTRLRIYPAETNSVSATSGSIYIQDAQLNYGLVAQDYIETTTAAVYEGITDNLPRLDYSGGASCPSLKLEPSRTNVLQNSEYFSGSDWINNGVTITDNAAISPEGKTNAALLTGVSGGLGIVKFSTWTATNKVASCFAKAGSGNIFKIANVSAANRYVLFDLSDGTISEESASWTGAIEDFGNGWYRCTAISNNETGTFSLGTTAASDSVYIYGAQLEAGSYQTSYIPTYGTSASRAADSCSKTGISSLIGQTEGTLYAEINLSSIKSAGTYSGFRIYDGTSSNEIAFIFYPTGRVQATTFDGGSLVVNIDNSGYGLAAGVHKIALAYKVNDYVLYIDGSIVGADTSASVPATSQVDLFHNNGGSLNQKQALLFKTRLTNDELAALTTI